MVKPDSEPRERSSPQSAVDQANAEAENDDADPPTQERARRMASEAEQREAERHDEYDDPDQGGEG